MISCNARFTDCDSSTYPPVVNYNYSGNVSTRSTNDRSFTWEDISKRSIYLYDEVTVSGNFESNNYTGTHTGALAPAVSGINYIITGSTQVDSASYPGWYLSGQYSFRIGQSGTTVTTSMLTGLTGSFSAFPIEGSESIGLYSYTGTPAIYSNTFPTGEGFILPAETHQVFGLFRSVYGRDSYVSIYPRGWNSNQVVANYDYTNAVWSLTAPTGTFFVAKTGYTEIKYNFVASDFPAAAPTGYDIVIKLMSTGSCVVVDDIHIDAVLKKNAFVDNIAPSGYIIEMTPDLGWHNILDMFSSEGTTNNPFLKTLGPFSVDGGNLIDNLDKTVTAVVDTSQFNTAINNRYPRYLWRAIALSDNGEYGQGSFPQKFTYVGDDINTSFSVTSVSESADSTIKTIVGTRSNRSTILVNDIADYSALSYPTSTSWKLVYLLNSPKTTLKLQAVDQGGATSSIKYLELTNIVFDQNTQALWNVFDEHGLLVDLERLPKEDNYNYSNRIKDVLRNPGGATFVGVVNGGTRELGLDRISGAITISIAGSETNQPLVSEILVEVGGADIKVRVPSMLTEELLYVDPVYHTVTLTKYPFEFPEYCELVNGKPIKLSSLEWDSLNEEFGTAIKLKISDPETHGKYVLVRYEHYEKLNFKDYPTLGSLVEALNNLTTTEDAKYLNATLSDLLSGGEDCLGLYQTSATVTVSDFSVPWSPMYLKRISDRAFREYKHDKVSYRRSKFYKYVSQLQLNSRTLWGSVQTDRDYWDAADSSSASYDTIPTLMDPDMSEFYSVLTGTTAKIDGAAAWARSYIGYSGEALNNLGVQSVYFQPGVGFRNDLTPGIHYTNTYKYNTTSEFLGISEIKRDNNTVIFSGQS